MLDGHYTSLVERALSPQIGTDDTAFVSQIIDCAKYAGPVEFVIATGTLADANATFAVKIEDGDNAALSDAAEVPDANLLGTEAAAGFAYSNDDSIYKIGYVPRKRYVRATVTPSGNTGNAPIAIVAIGRPLVSQA